MRRVVDEVSTASPDTNLNGSTQKSPQVMLDDSGPDADSLHKPREHSVSFRSALLPASTFGTIILGLFFFAGLCHLLAVLYLSSVPTLASNTIYREIFTQQDLQAGKALAQTVTALSIGVYLVSVLCAIPMAVKSILRRFV